MDRHNPMNERVFPQIVRIFLLRNRDLLSYDLLSYKRQARVSVIPR